MKKKNNSVKPVVDEFLVNKEGRSVLKGIEKRNLVKDGLIDSLDIFTLSSMIEKKIKRKIDIADPKVFKKFQKYKDLINI